MKMKDQIEIRLTKLEEALEQHLRESGEIRTDLAWIKKAMWVAVPLIASVPFTLLVTIIAYLLKMKP
jgi:hypothetical protein